MSLKKYYGAIMLGGALVIGFAVVGTALGNHDAPLIGVIAAAVMALAWWSKHGWENPEL